VALAALAVVEAVVLEEEAPVAVGSILTSAEKKSLHAVILKMDKAIAGEIHLAFYKSAEGDDVLQAAKKYFHRLNLHKSPHKNTVLIYILEQDRRFAILGDAGIHAKVPPDYWNDLSAQLSLAFQQGHFYNGLIACLKQLEEDIKRHYPKALSVRD
jgi:uncharacterized membrane protein YgcG